MTEKEVNIQKEIKKVKIEVPEYLKDVYESQECAQFIKLLNIKDNAERLFAIYMDSWCDIYMAKEDKEAENEKETRELEIAVIIGKILGYEADEVISYASYLVDEASKKDKDNNNSNNTEEVKEVQKDK